jgi:hypothetical protein
MVQEDTMTYETAMTQVLGYIDHPLIKKYRWPFTGDMVSMVTAAQDSVTFTHCDDPDAVIAKIRATPREKIEPAPLWSMERAMREAALRAEEIP